MIDVVLGNLNSFSFSVKDIKNENVGSLIVEILGPRNTTPLGFRLYSHFYDGQDITRGVISHSVNTDFSELHAFTFLFFISSISQSINNSKLVTLTHCGVGDNIVYFEDMSGMEEAMIKVIFDQYNKTIINPINGDGGLRGPNNRIPNVESPNRGNPRGFSSSSRGTKYKYEFDIANGVITKIRFSNIKEFTSSILPALRRTHILQNIL
jgi:hypothetical protein